MPSNVPEMLVNWYKPPWETAVSAISNVPDPLPLEPLVVQLNVSARTGGGEKTKSNDPEANATKRSFVNTTAEMTLLILFL